MGREVKGRGGEGREKRGEGGKGHPVPHWESKKVATLMQGCKIYAKIHSPPAPVSLAGRLTCYLFFMYKMQAKLTVNSLSSVQVKRSKVKITA